MAGICFLFSALLMAVPVALQPLISTDEKLALSEFKNRITSDPQAIFSRNWSSTTDPCSWLGVTCSLLQKRVIISSLNISGYGLEGTISPFIGNLTFLTSLDISLNNFSGSLPTELGNLHGLKQMNLGSNNLSGEILSSFGTLSQLQLLHLGNNNFTGIVPSSIFSSNMSKLESLDLGYNLLEGSIPTSISNLTNLRVLFLGYNQFTGSVPPGIYGMPSLETLVLSQNRLVGTLPRGMCTTSHQSKLKGIYLSFNHLQGEIPLELYRCRNIEDLSLSYNEFNGTIPRTIGLLSKLKRLYIGGNKLAGRIPSELGNLTLLEELSIRSSLLTGRIPLSVFNLSSLRQIDLSNNSLSGSFLLNMVCDLPGIQWMDLSDNRLNGSIPSCIWNCKTLLVLDLSKNNFTGDVSKGIGNLTLLQQLMLNDNQLTGELPIEFGNRVNLGKFSFDNNNLSGTIPPGIFNMSSLTYMSLMSNRLSGALPQNMWITLPELQEIYLSENEFSGMLPSYISNASKITIMAMVYNSFSGPVPHTLGNLQFLRRILLGGNNFTREASTPELTFITSFTHCRQLDLVELSENQFHGFLPRSLGNFSVSLQEFKAFGSMIKGTIPSEIGNLSSLESIYFDNNDLTGSIPSTIGKLTRVERIYLEHNRLQGKIPDEICNLKNLGDLYVNENMLSGSIPECLGELKSLRAIYLHSNNLSSKIPSSLWGLKDLLGLNLSLNSLTGQLPSEIGKWEVITQLDLSGNQLSGTIPTSLGSTESLVYLSLAQNKFEGKIPESLGSLLSLEYLDLSRNGLSGSIPKSLEKLEYMKYFNVSYNGLEGEVPTGGPFANFTAQSFLHNYALCGAVRLHFPACESKTKSKSRLRKVLSPLIYIFPVIAILGILVLVAVLWRRKKYGVARTVEQAMDENKTRLDFPQWRRISYVDLLRATDSFSENNLIGAGSFGSVYRGTFPDGSVLAIKVFNLQWDDDHDGTISKSFAAECKVLASIRHRNLIKIISSCCVNFDPPQPQFKALVLEYMPNGSLENWLYPGQDCSLDILQRLDIMIDVASALEYLHFYHTFPVVHCDLKPSNILLDEDMVAHVCDFGIAKLFGEGESVAQTRTLATFGYMAPEYGTEGIVSTSGDVYSYGIVLIETFTRKKPTDDFGGAEEEPSNLKQWVKKAIQENAVVAIVDSNLSGNKEEEGSMKKRKAAGYKEVEEECLMSIFHVGLNCLVDSPQDRINMRDIVNRLKMIKLAVETCCMDQGGIGSYYSNKEEDEEPILSSRGVHFSGATGEKED